MYQIDNQSRYAVYEQIVDQVEKYVLSGILQPKEQMPSVRSLSLELNINPNTVQKAYTELERKGIIFTMQGRGTFIHDLAKQILRQIKKQSLKNLKPMLQELALAGVDKQEIIDLIEDVYKEEKV